MSDDITNSEEFKRALAEAKAEAEEAAEAKAEGLKAKNSELLGKIKKLQQGQQIDPADLQEVENERDELKAKLTDANKALAKAQKAAEDATKKAADIDSAYSKSIADSALTEALTKAGVTNPVHLKAAKALLSGSLAVADEDGQRVVKAGDKALADFTQEWASSDEGKHFVTAHDASGGGSQGGRGNGGSGDKIPDVHDKQARAARFAERLAHAQE